MELEFSDDEAALRENVADVLDGIAPPAVVRAIFEGKPDDGTVWRRMVELDWPALCIAEQHGGIGMGFVELAIVAEQLGRTLAPGPYLATTTQFVPVVQELAGDDVAHRVLTRVAAGELTGSLALAEGGSWRPTRVATTAAPVEGGGWVLTGRKDSVLHGATVDELVVIARSNEGLGAFLVPRPDVEVVARDVIDPTLPVADIVLAGVSVPADRVVVAPGVEVAPRLVRALDQAVTALAVATVATCRRIFDDALAYAKAREQYGRPIGSFQALKHRFADLYLAVERASALGWFAALTIAEDDPRRREAASLAKAAAGECTRLVVRDGLQLHGGIGMTWEHDLHFFLKRAKVGDALFGGVAEHRALLAEQLGLIPAEALA